MPHFFYPGFATWWKRKHAEGGCAAHAGCGAGRSAHHGREGYYAEGGEGGSFGVRRPLRFLAYKLELNESQVAELARILSELKTERAQAEVDSRRTLGAFADSLTGEQFDAAKAADGAALRLKSAERLREAVLRALERVHTILQPEQREKLAYLIRTGTVTL